MKALRSVVFWLHLGCGVVASAVILIMSVTGVALTYQRQMQYWADTRHYRSVPLPDAPRLPLATLVDRASAAGDTAAPASIAIRADRTAPAAVTVGSRTVYVDPYTGHVHGEGRGQTMRAFFSAMVRWHRYIALAGDHRPLGKAITGAANLIFLFIVVSGLYLWWPRTLSWTHVRSALWFRRTATAKARDFNWHNVLGFWSAIPLAIVVASATVISHPWASNLVYRLAGEAPPAPARRASTAGAAARSSTGATGEEPRGSRAAPEALDAAAAVAAESVPDWRILTLRTAAAGAPIAVTVDRGDGGQPHLRSSVTYDPTGTTPPQWDGFAMQSRGRQWRSLLRFAHTGEAAGLVGQTIAGAVSAAAVVLVWTGLSLALRRLGAWTRRRHNRVNDRIDRAA